MLRTVIPKAYNIHKRLGSSSCGKKRSDAEFIEITEKCVASTVCPLPCVIEKGKGVTVTDVSGKSYLDFTSGCGAVALGHAHPKMIKAIAEQLKLVAHTSRDVFTKALADYAEFITELFCYEKVLPMNTGNDACETAVKLARKWGYKEKNICSNQAKVLFAENNYWGSSIAAISSSTNPDHFQNYGPFVPNLETVPYNDPSALAERFRDPNVCAFVVEPVQVEAGVIIPDPCYLREVRKLCSRFKVLMIADEIQTGLGKCGSMLCCDIYNVKPDILVLGKALSGGIAPVSAVLADSNIMDVIEPKTHGSTFGGNPFSCKIAMSAIRIIQDENLVENAQKMGEALRGCLCDLPKDIVCEVRGIGLINALVLNCRINSMEVCKTMMNNGLLALASNQTIRLCPPLSIKEKEIMKAAKIIRHCIENSRGCCEDSD